MSYQVLARKWRPQRFDDVIAQEHITNALKKAITSNRVAHAYLLTGTRGVGKTSIARIFAKALRCESRGESANPCGKCVSCLAIADGSCVDYLEVDGASNNSVDNIRQIVENAQYLPSSGQYKVFVIDEVHMLSVSAFNALLKTLEEPPSHVIFIFATTEPHKLLGTVLSRCQRYDFKNITVDLLEKQLRHIAQQEGISFENDKVLTQLCRQGRGSMRDTLSLLDQVLALSEGREVHFNTLLHSLGLAQAQAQRDLMLGLLAADLPQITQTYKSIIESGVDVKKLCHQLLEELYHLATEQYSLFVTEDQLTQLGVQKAELIWLYELLSKDFNWVLESLSPSHALEVALHKACLRTQLVGSAGKNHKTEPEAKKKNQITPDQQPPLKLQSTGPNKEAMDDGWQGFINYVKLHYPALLINLERTNIFDKIKWSPPTLKIVIAIKRQDSLFLDSLNEKEIQGKLMELLSSYYEVPQKDIQFDLKALGDDEVIEHDFKSILDIEAQRTKADSEEQKKQLLNNTFIKQAQKIFNTKVERIILKDGL